MINQNALIAQRNSELLRELDARDRRPTGVMIQVSAKCNLGCRMCGYVGKTPNPGFIDTALFTHILAQLRQFGVDSIWLETAWGEPMLHPGIFELLELARGFKVVLSTNITPLNQPRIERLAEFGLHYLQLSFCGFDQESYEGTYVGGKFEQVVRNLKLVHNLFRERAPATTLLISGVALADDPRFIEKTKAFVGSLGFREEEMEFKLAHNFGGQFQVATVDADTGIHTFKDIRGQKPDLCSVLMNNPGILVDGRVTACGCLDNAGAMIIGDIRTQTLRDIMHGAPYETLLQRFMGGDLRGMPLCEKCDIPYGSSRIVKY